MSEITEKPDYKARMEEIFLYGIDSELELIGPLLKQQCSPELIENCLRQVIANVIDENIQERNFLSSNNFGNTWARFVVKTKPFLEKYELISSEKIDEIEHRLENLLDFKFQARGGLIGKILRAIDTPSRKAARLGKIKALIVAEGIVNAALKE